MSHRNCNKSVNKSKSDPTAMLHSSSPLISFPQAKTEDRVWTSKTTSVSGCRTNGRTVISWASPLSFPHWYKRCRRPEERTKRVGQLPVRTRVRYLENGIFWDKVDRNAPVEQITQAFQNWKLGTYIHTIMHICSIQNIQLRLVFKSVNFLKVNMRLSHCKYLCIINCRITNNLITKNVYCIFSISLYTMVCWKKILWNIQCLFIDFSNYF